MFRSSPRRSQRSKGFKVRHALQITLLLGVSIWLLYQLKHSQDKKTATTEASPSVSDVFKLGRKYLHPHKDETSIVDARHKEDDGDEEIKNDVLTYKPDEMDDNTVGKVGEANDTVPIEHHQDNDKNFVDQEKETQLSDEHVDPEQEVGEHNSNGTEEKEREDNNENADKVENGESKEGDKRLSEKIEVNESERADHIEDVSTVNQNEESKESVNEEGKEKEKENEQTKDQAEEEDGKYVEKNKDGGEAKDGAEGSQKQEQNKQDDDAADSSSKAVENQIQHVPDSNSTENVTNNTEVVDDARNQNLTNDEDGSKNEEKTGDTSQTSFMTESSDPLQEKGNSVTDSSGTSNPSVQNGTQSIMENNRTSEGDDNNLKNIEENQTPEFASGATSEQSSIATDAAAATSGEFKDSTTHPELHDNDTQTKTAGDETGESSSGEKPNNNPSEEGTQENIVLSDTNGNAHAEKYEQVVSSDTALESKRQGLSTSDNKGGAGQSETDKLVMSNATDNERNREAGENGHVNTSDASSLKEDASANTANTDENVVIRMEDENGNTGQNESSKYHQEIEESLQANSNEDANQKDRTKSKFSLPQDAKEA